MWRALYWRYGRCEGGAQIYRILADQADSEEELKVLTESAEREEQNARVLDGITTE